MPAINTVQQPTETSWYDVWGKLKNTVVKLDDAVLKLENSRNYAMSRPNLRSDYLSKMSDVQSMRSKALWLRDNIKSAMSVLGVELSGTTGLGIAPVLLLWPIVAGGVTWLGSKTLDLWQFSQRVDEQKRLEATGMNPEQAAALARQTAESGGITSDISSIVKYVVIGGIVIGAYYFWSKRK